MWVGLYGERAGRVVWCEWVSEWGWVQRWVQGWPTGSNGGREPARCRCLQHSRSVPAHATCLSTQWAHPAFTAIQLPPSECTLAAPCTRPLPLLSLLDPATLRFPLPVPPSLLLPSPSLHPSLLPPPPFRRRLLDVGAQHAAHVRPLADAQGGVGAHRRVPLHQHRLHGRLLCVPQRVGP